ncbi:hypothetical protein LMH66_18025 [Shewanella sp. 10N.7]|uniref:hypothetical protein n=1 Tax=unclassified Shewanella TaxID=196818 RepID=UPI001588BFC5|nr:MULTISPECIES: hypothetical protein [unclassified Shewanella]MCC4834548.1 hypothetical protein [Shewanella sp. 10N.7]USN27058.1 hypothetical protein [synthetic construct]
MIAQLSDYQTSKSASPKPRNDVNKNSNVRLFEQKKTSIKFEQAKRQVSEAASKLDW